MSARSATGFACLISGGNQRRIEREGWTIFRSPQLLAQLLQVQAVGQRLQGDVDAVVDGGRLAMEQYSG